MWEKLKEIKQQYKDLTQRLADPDVMSNPAQLAELAQERTELEEMVKLYNEHQTSEQELIEARTLLDEEDSEMRELAEAEVDRLEKRLDVIERKLRRLLLPKDPRDERNVIVEIRAGAGGDEAGLFAAELYRMYARYAERQGWRTDVLNANPTGIGGYKEVVFQVQGRGAFSRLKFESGVHRVQRVPVTESSGRIHTSTVTVAVLPEADEVEVDIDLNDVEFQVYGASGPGGQHMQKNATAVRITHKPTGTVVACESERSQSRNRTRALAILRARLYEAERQRQVEEMARSRRAQVGTGERSEKIRTYNFPQNRVTDHRIGFTLHRLPDVLDGDLDPFVEELRAVEMEEQLEAVVEGEI